MLEKESEVAIKWSSDDNMIVNPKKFQAILINRQSKPNNNCCLTINNAETKSKESALLISKSNSKSNTSRYWNDNKLNFEKHVSTICKKANNQLNAISKIDAVLGEKEKEILINSFVYFNFNCGPLI